VPLEIRFGGWFFERTFSIDSAQEGLTVGTRWDNLSAIPTTAKDSRGTPEPFINEGTGVTPIPRDRKSNIARMERSQLNETMDWNSNRARMD
jgi:hypothetical protein